MTEIIVVIVSALLAAIAVSFVAYQGKKRAQNLRNALVSEIEKQRVEISAGLDPVRVARVVERGTLAPTVSSAELMARIEEQILAKMAASPPMTKEEVRHEVRRQFSELQARILKIESRFPEEAKLDKISSINDALLSERIDQLSQQVNNLEERILSKWDVALTVSTIIAGIALVVGATYAVMKFIGKAP
jgi:type II secretory pathway pseudopilin PulG